MENPEDAVSENHCIPLQHSECLISTLYAGAVPSPEIYDVDDLRTLSLVSVYEGNLSFIVAIMPLQCSAMPAIIFC
jgi:hypothetical protein